MNFAPQFIPVIQKASNVCAYCRVRKQRCDRSFPRCERCVLKGRDCDYTPYKEPPRNETHEDEPLIVHYETCQHTDLSPRGTTELLHAVTACINESSSSHLATKLSDLVHELLDLADVDLRAALEEFGPCIQQWCPIIPEEFLHGCTNDLSQQMSGGYDPKSPLLWLCLWLVTRRTCQHWDHIERSELYRATKQVLALLQSRKEIDLEVVHIGMLITVFEVGHAMQTQASQTLAGCIALLRILGLDSRKSKDSGLMETVDWIKVSMLMLDRMVPISMTIESIPLILLSSDPISKTVSKTVGPTIPPHSPRTFASSPRKVHIRAAVSLAAGHVQEYIHARRYEYEPEQTYDEVDEIINKCIKKLVDKPEPHTWLHCDAIAMAFCSHILLQASQMQHLAAILPHTHTLEPPTSEYMKTHLALKYSRRMAWDMIPVAIKKIQSETEISHLPFAGLCCVFRAGLAVIETRDFVNEDVAGEEEVQGFRKLLVWFAGRWNIGGEYLRRLDELLGQS